MEWVTLAIGLAAGVALKYAADAWSQMWAYRGNRLEELGRTVADMGDRQSRSLRVLQDAGEVAEDHGHRLARIELRLGMDDGT